MHSYNTISHIAYKAISGFLLFTLLSNSLAARQNQVDLYTQKKKIPVTQRRFNDDTSKLQFAIISDVWGGRRPGVFEDALDKLELLQPQFVISVGDLTDGKTYDTTLMDKEWDEFDKSVNSLSMPFFYVPGNHDIGNPLMEREWKKRNGSPYYHFVYKNVLFLCVNTEDGGHGGIRDEQAAYFKKTIEENANVRWTFIFMHRPVWQGKNEKEEGYEKIEAVLKGRNYTLFSGHHHTYLSVVKNGNKHFVLGTTGGGSDLRGEKFGEFDHLTLVTLGNTSPKIINLELNGIIKEDVVNEKEHAITETLIDENWLIPVPFVSEHQHEKMLVATVIFDNPTDYPLKVTGQLCGRKEYTISPCLINISVAPKSKIVQPVIISKDDQSLIDLASLSSVDISLNGQYFYNDTSYMLPARKKLLLSWKLVPNTIGKTTNQLYHGWDTTGMISLTSPEYLDGKWYWSGAEDGLLRFKLIKDEKFVYVTALLNDDQWVAGPQEQKDLLYLYVEDANGNPNRITATPGDNKIMVEGKGSITLNDITFKKYFDNQTFMAEFKIPIDKLIKKDNSVRINIGFRDQDNIPEKESSILFWKPLWGTSSDYKDSGTFLLK